MRRRRRRKVKLIFQNSRGEERVIAEPSNREEVNKEIPDSSMIISIKSEEKLIKHVNGYIDSYDDWVKEYDIKEYKIKVFYREERIDEPLFPG